MFIRVDTEQDIEVAKENLYRGERISSLEGLKKGTMFRTISVPGSAEDGTPIRSTGEGTHRDGRTIYACTKAPLHDGMFNAVAVLRFEGTEIYVMQEVPETDDMEFILGEIKAQYGG